MLVLKHWSWKNEALFWSSAARRTTLAVYKAVHCQFLPHGPSGPSSDTEKEERRWGGRERLADCCLFPLVQAKGNKAKLTYFPSSFLAPVLQASPTCGMRSEDGLGGDWEKILAFKSFSPQGKKFKCLGEEGTDGAWLVAAAEPEGAWQRQFFSMVL